MHFDLAAGSRAGVCSSGSPTVRSAFIDFSFTYVRNDAINMFKEYL